MNLSLLLLLICPLMMVSMMFGMKGKHGRSAHSKQSETDWTLHVDYNELKVQNEMLKKEIQSLSK
ncbi:DUF2933 domain-containing protein [Paenibacillus sp. URB8-2]|uniref:DUF2933 domain-containing protein n=1 Tax=Paenibacillus sp. URB8-2 TaxID=2741301 RepID=UPI0015BE270E|nr:DUF2933 domain-containing protein [Paenibacillus sp. URB8-2]BCG60402.1 hypothetical protein PUR_38270 [Paenibacillus sp. URB8-2]